VKILCLWQIMLAIAAERPRTISKTTFMWNRKNCSSTWSSRSIHLGHTLAAYATLLLKGRVIEQRGYVVTWITAKSKNRDNETMAKAELVATTHCCGVRQTEFPCTLKAYSEEQDMPFPFTLQIRLNEPMLNEIHRCLHKNSITHAHLSGWSFPIASCMLRVFNQRFDNASSTPISAFVCAG